MRAALISLTVALGLTAALMAACVRTNRSESGTSPRFRVDAWNLPNEPLLGFIAVPAGTVTMGSDAARDPLAVQEEMPSHQITLGPYFIGRYEVTVGQYKACVRAGGCVLRDRRALEGPEELPVRYVSWHDAVTYCGWLQGQLLTWAGTPPPILQALAGRRSDGPWQVVLPSEAEWERAARGTDGRLYPWGDRFDATRANVDAPKQGKPSPVGSFPGGASPIGALDMSGNVTEWTRSHYTPRYPYPYDPADGRESLTVGDLPDRVTRGGSFSQTAIGTRVAARDGADTANGFGFLGFRVAISAIGPSR